MEPDPAAALTSLRFSIVSGGVAVLAGVVVVAVALPGFVRYRADEAMVDDPQA